MLNTVIVTGANGFIGRHLVEELLKLGITTFAIIRSDISNALLKNEIINDKLKIIVFDYMYVEQLKYKLPKGCDACFNLAWGGVTGIRRYDYKLQLNNVERTLDLMKAMSDIYCKRFIGASSISECEADLYMPVDGAVVGNRFIYSISKMTSHYMNKCLSQTLGIEYINALISNTYGEYGSNELILHDTIIKLLRNIPTSFTSGNQTYDFLYVKDVVEGLILLADKGRKNCSYYIGSGKARELKWYLEITKNIINPYAKLGFGLREHDGMNLPREVFDIEKIKQHTGFQPRYAFEDSIKNAIKWYEAKLEHSIG